MELRVLRYFLTAAREESITGAAVMLNITQPTLSRQLAALEEELGKKLFIRGSRKITLTEDGMFLRQRAQEIVDLTEKTEAALTSSAELVSGSIFIGAGETDAVRLIARAVKKLRETQPNIRYQLFSGNAEDVIERLDKGLLDFGLLIGNVDTKKYDYLQLPTVDTWGLLMRKDSELASSESIKTEVLRNIPLLLCSQQALLRNELAAWLGGDFYKLDIVAHYNLIYNAALMVDEGVGYALCLDKLLNTTGNSRLCFRPLNPRFESRLYLVWKKYQVLSKAAEKFIDVLQKQVHNDAIS